MADKKPTPSAPEEEPVEGAGGVETKEAKEEKPGSNSELVPSNSEGALGSGENAPAPSSIIEEVEKLKLYEEDLWRRLNLIEGDEEKKQFLWQEIMKLKQECD